MKFRDHILAYILLPLVALLIAASYYRFIAVHDYMVSYEGTCDPAVHVCFIGCNDDDSDDACADTYYYDKVKKYAVDVYAQCGKDITDCEAANVCLPEGDRECLITYCNPATDGDTCKIPAEESENMPEATSTPEEPILNP